MAAGVDPAEYLGLHVPGGEVDRRVSGILARHRGWRSGHVGALPTAKVVGRGAAQGVERMSAAGFVGGMVRLLHWFLRMPVAGLWSAVVFLWIWKFWLPVLLPALAILYFLIQGLVFLPAFETVQRRVWYEDLDHRFGLSDIIPTIRRSLLSFLAWVIAGPFVIPAAALRFVRASSGRHAVCDLWRRAKRAIGRETHREWNDLLYNQATDWSRLQYWRVTNFFRRQGLRIFIGGVMIWVGWLCFSSTAGSGETVHFNSMQEMAAHFGVPQDPFLPKKEVGSNSHYRRELWEAVRAGDEGLAFEGGVGIADSISAAKVATLVEDQDKELIQMAAEDSEMMQSEIHEEAIRSRNPEEPVAVQRLPLGEGQVAYCRRCRQRHCCEAMDEEPAPTTLSLEL